ncbi:hypothetical protein LTR84_000800 [Exophiala bonariae]|uniref:Uncharacterized protein n=1 Tax=Exophiala bonariae TaxID=1690606 RepID=A0AAV9NVL0_9EURO|nr:hypothetical protein LTR84_000800 [Exophiala bonariae]
METAPLTLAQTHARNATLETERSNPVAASEEHDLAAAEFAAAAHGTSDIEALRILNLLQQHHKKLGRLLRESHEKPRENEATRTASSTTASTATAPSSHRATSPEATPRPPRLPQSVSGRSNPHDLSSSLASNLASARGIPSVRQKRPTPVSPLVSNQHADGQISQDDARARQTISRQGTDSNDHLLSMSRQANTRPSWAPPTTTKSDSADKVEAEHSTEPSSASDAPFQQFYATFESLVSKLSAPLAFAGLPLTVPAPTKVQPALQTPPSPKSPKAPTRSSPAPPAVDYSQLISRAALRAVSENPANGHNPSESFYVVPTTGGTVSYAEIMNRAEREELRGLRHHRQTSNLTNISEDDFVDAQSTILPHSRTREPSSNPTLGRFRRNGPDEAKVGGKTMEELSMENQALKHLSDTLSKRLHVFEMSAQTSTAALTQSIRSLHMSPLTTPLLSPENSRGKNSARPLDTGGADEGLLRRIAELEDILRKSDARTRKKEEENAKLKETISKYKEKWESLKAGAKARRERERKGGGEKGGDAGEGASTRGATDDGNQ